MQLSLLVSQSVQDRSLPRAPSWQRMFRPTHSLAALVTYIDAILAMAPVTCEGWNPEPIVATVRLSIKMISQAGLPVC